MLRRFYFAPGAADNSLVRLAREESHHLARVLRLQPSEEVELFDGCGNLYRGRIERIDRQVSVRILAQLDVEAEKPSPLRVCQGDLKGKKMDMVVQKCTELGVARFLPFTSSRSQGRSDDERREKKHERWQKLVESACKQSLRLRFMVLDQERSFSELLDLPAASGAGRKLLFWEQERHRRLTDFDWHGGDAGVYLMLGPEGGFSEQEVAAARERGWHTVGLGDRILRAETATISAVSIVQHLLGVI